MIYAFEGHQPDIAADAWVADDANVIGKIALAAESSIWFGATLRGDNELISIGARSNLQENVICHTDPGLPLTVGEDCTIGHRALLHGCTIGDGTLIGMGAMVMNGAVVGKGCLIGAGALIPEGKVIPDGSLVMGMPGRVIRALDEAARAGLIQSAAGYVAKAARFRAGLHAL